MTVKIKHNKAHVLYKALGYDHWGEEHKMAVRHGTYNAAITCYSVNMKCDPLVVQDL